MSDRQLDDPRFPDGQPKGGGFDDAHDVVRHDGRDRSAAGAAAELSRLRQSPRFLVAQQALADSAQPLLHIVEDKKPSIFDELGDHLTPESNLSTRAKIELMQAMLKEKAGQDRIAAMRATQDAHDAYDASRRHVSTHEANTPGGVLLELPINKPRSKKYGPKRTGHTVE